MTIQDMKRYPNNTDSWIVISPGRTGIRLICASLQNIYNNNLKFHHAGINNHLPMKYLDLVHTHIIDDLDLILEDTQCILSTRDMVESALSFCIQPHIGHWHIFKHYNIPNIIIKPFILNINDFFHHYNRVVQFFKTIDNKLQKNTIIIDYSEFCNDINNIPKILGYEVELDIVKMPIKNPGKYSDWILNWEEIKIIINDLPRTVKW